MNDLCELVIKAVLKDFNEAVETNDKCHLEKILANHSQLIHPSYRDLNVSTVAEFFIEFQICIPPTRRIPQEWENEVELELFLHLVFIERDVQKIQSDINYLLAKILESENLTMLELFLENIVRIRNKFNFDENLLYSTILLSSFYRVLRNVPEILRIVLKYEPNIKKKNLVNYLAFSNIFKSEDIMKIARILLQADCGVNDPCTDGTTSLASAIKSKKTDLALFLIENGAHVNITSPEGNPHQPLPLAIKHYQGISLVEKIIEKGANLDATSENGQTALHLACFYRYEDCINLLIKKGADVLLRDSKKKTPLAILEYFNIKTSIITLFVKEIAKAEFEFESRGVIGRDWQIIQNFGLKDFYTSCRYHLEKLKNTIFYPPFSYLDVLRMRNKSVKKLADLSRKKNFIRIFEVNLSYNNIYYKDLTINIQEAKIVKDKYDKVGLMLKSIIGEYLPIELIMIIVNFIEVQDLPSLPED